jgi:hypothetical protein
MIFRCQPRQQVTEDEQARKDNHEPFRDGRDYGRWSPTKRSPRYRRVLKPLFPAGKGVGVSIVQAGL